MIMNTNIYKIICLACTLAGAVSCTDKFDNEEGKSPTWLGSNIYDYLNERGDCKYFVRLIDDEGLTKVMQLTGSNTLFFADDQAFDRFFAHNDMGITSYEQLPESMKRLFLRFGVIDNSQLIERLSKSDEGNLLLRRTTDMEVKDTIPTVKASELPDNDYFASLRNQGKEVKLLQDGTKWTLVQFFPTVMKGKGFTNTDLQFITGNKNASIDSVYLYDNRIVKQDLICKNGYLHELENVLTPPENMAGYIRSNEKLSEFNRLLNRFCTPKLYNVAENGDSIWEMRYFNRGKRPLNTDNNGKAISSLLTFDPGWNLYASTTAGGKQEAYEQTMGCMFVPTNDAMKSFFSPTGEGADFYNAFGTWDKVPTTMIADIINANMKNSFLTALPSNFGNVVDEYGYTMNIKTSDVENCYIARNGLIYVTNKVFAPQDYKTVMGPAKIDLKNSIFAEAISNTDYTYYAYLLRAPKNIYYFFVTPDQYCKNYIDPVAQGYANNSFKCKLDFHINANNKIVATPISMATGDTIRNQTSFPLSNGTTVTTGIGNRMEDIAGQHTIVCSYDGELEDRIADGQEYFVSNSYAPVHIKSLNVGGHVGGTGNTSSLSILEEFKKENGRTFTIDGIMQSTSKSIYEKLSSSSDFSEFFNICEAIGIFSSSSVDKNAALNYAVNFLSRYHYTIYVPTNAAIKAAQAAGKIPTIAQWENEGDKEVKDSLEEVLLRFVKYHFQDNSVFIKGAKENSATYLSSTLNNSTRKFYPIKITNTGNSITLTDNTQNIAHVITSDGHYNIMARDILVNNSDRNSATEILSYSYAVIHQIDNILSFE